MSIEGMCQCEKDKPAAGAQLYTVACILLHGPAIKVKLSEGSCCGDMALWGQDGNHG